MNHSSVGLLSVLWLGGAAYAQGARAVYPKLQAPTEAEIRRFLEADEVTIGSRKTTVYVTGTYRCDVARGREFAESRSSGLSSASPTG